MPNPSIEAAETARHSNRLSRGTSSPGNRVLIENIRETLQIGDRAAIEHLNSRSLFSLLGRLCLQIYESPSRIILERNIGGSRCRLHRVYGFGGSIIDLKTRSGRGWLPVRGRDEMGRQGRLYRINHAITPQESTVPKRTSNHPEGYKTGGTSTLSR